MRIFQVTERDDPEQSFLVRTEDEQGLWDEIDNIYANDESEQSYVSTFDLSEDCLFTYLLKDENGPLLASGVHLEWRQDLLERLDKTELWSYISSTITANIYDFFADNAEYRDWYLQAVHAMLIKLSIGSLRDTYNVEFPALDFYKYCFRRTRELRPDYIWLNIMEF